LNVSGLYVAKITLCIVSFSGGEVISKTGRCDIATGANLIAFPDQGVIVEPADLIQITKVIKDIFDCKAGGGDGVSLGLILSIENLKKFLKSKIIDLRKGRDLDSHHINMCLFCFTLLHKFVLLQLEVLEISQKSLDELQNRKLFRDILIK